MQSQMHNFAAGTVGKSKTKRGGVINVNPPSLARRTFKVPGRGPAPLGRPLRDRAGQTQMFITDNEDIIARSDGNFIQQTKKKTQICQNSGDKYQCSKKTHKTIMVYSYNKSNTWKIFYLLYHFVRLKRLISGRSHKWRHHFWGVSRPPKKFLWLIDRQFACNG